MKSFPAPSQGELHIAKLLHELKYRYQPEYELPSLPDRRFDFFINCKRQYQKFKFVIEFDGQQHFQYTPTFHLTPADFMETQRRHLEKANAAIQAGIRVLRIDYTQINRPKFLEECI